MSDSNFNSIIVRDSRINDVSTKIDYMVSKGASQNNYQQINASSYSNSNINFNVTPPSEDTLIDRGLTITSNPTIRLNIDNVPAGALAMAYGKTEALNQFPLNSLFTTSTVTINSASNSVNTRDVLYTLVRMTDDEQFSKYNCPHMADRKFKKYTDMAESESNALGSFKDSKMKAIPRGAHPISFSIIKTPDGAGPNPVITNANTDVQITNALTSGHLGDTWVIDITFESTEPLLFLSPFLYGKDNNNNAALFGVRSMSFF